MKYLVRRCFVTPGMTVDSRKTRRRNVDNFCGFFLIESEIVKRVCHVKLTFIFLLSEVQLQLLFMNTAVDALLPDRLKITVLHFLGNIFGCILNHREHFKREDVRPWNITLVQWNSLISHSDTILSRRDADVALSTFRFPWSGRGLAHSTLAKLEAWIMKRKY